MHPNILATYEFLHDRENYYIANATAKGDNLRSLVEHLGSKPLPEWQVKRVAFQLLSALNHLVENMIVH